jgi:hypothetical protein
MDFDELLDISSEEEDELVAEFLKKRHAPRTQKAYDSAGKKWEKWCAKKGIDPYAADGGALTRFAALLDKSKLKANSKKSILEAVNTRFEPKIEKAKKADLHKCFERGAEPAEQAKALSIKIIREVARHVETDVDEQVFEDAVLMFFLCARPDTVLRGKVADEPPVKKKDITLLQGGGAGVYLTKFKNSTSAKNHDIEFEALTKPITVKLRDDSFELCPAKLARALKIGNQESALFNTSTYSSFSSRWKQLAGKAGLKTTRGEFSPYCTRVGGVCTLLKAGLDEAVIKKITGWKSDMVERYGERVMLRPDEVQAYKFYNPKGLAGKYKPF